MDKKQLVSFLEKILTGEAPKKAPKGLEDVSLGLKEWSNWYQKLSKEKPEGLRFLPPPKKPIESLPRPTTKQEHDYQVLLYKKGLLKTPPPPFEVPLVSAPDILDVMPTSSAGKVAGKVVEKAGTKAVKRIPLPPQRPKPPAVERFLGKTERWTRRSPLEKWERVAPEEIRPGRGGWELIDPKKFKGGEFAGRGEGKFLWEDKLRGLRKSKERRLPMIIERGGEFAGRGEGKFLWEDKLRELRKSKERRLPMIFKPERIQGTVDEIPSQAVRGRVVDTTATEIAEKPVQEAVETAMQKPTQEAVRKGIFQRILPKVLPGAILGGTGYFLYNLLKDQKQESQKQVGLPEEKPLTTGKGTKLGGLPKEEAGEQTFKLEEPNLDLKIWEGATFPSLSQAQQQTEQAKEQLEKGNIENILSAYQSTLNAMVGVRNSYDDLKRFVYQGVIEVLTRPLEPPPNLQPSEEEKAIRGITSGLLGLAMAFAPPSKVDFYAGILAGYQDALLSHDEARKREALELYKMNLDRDLRTREMQLQALQTQLQYLQGAEQKDIENVKLQMDYLNTLLDMELQKMQIATQQAKELQKWLWELYKEQLKHEHAIEREKLKSQLRREEEREKQKGRERLLQMRQTAKPKTAPNEDLLRLLLEGKPK
jgi:hypothetical protein